MHFALIIGAIFMQASERGPGAQGSIGMRWCCPLSIPGFDLVPPTMRKSQYTIRTREKDFLACFFYEMINYDYPCNWTVHISACT